MEPMHKIHFVFFSECVYVHAQVYVYDFMCTHKCVCVCTWVCAYGAECWLPSSIAHSLIALRRSLSLNVESHVGFMSIKLSGLPVSAPHHSSLLPTILCFYKLPATSRNWFYQK